MARPSTTTQRNRPAHAHSSDKFTDCARVCNETLAYCLDQGGDHAKADHLKALIDCIDVCTVSARLHERESPLSKQAMELCEQACEACEASCKEFEGDEMMQKCAKACNDCCN